MAADEHGRLDDAHQRPGLAAGGREVDLLGAHEQRHRLARQQSTAGRADPPAAGQFELEHAVRAGRAGHGGLQHVRLAHEVGDVAARRPVVDLLGGAYRRDTAPLHHGHAIGHRQRFLLVVRDVEEGHPETLLDRFQLGLHLAPDPEVERSERLVEQPIYRRPLHERARECHALLLTARKF